MTEILTFPTKQQTDSKRRNAIETLEYILERVKAGDTNPQGIVIVWNDASDDETFKLRYILGGKISMAETVGMLEMTKQDMLDD